MFNAPLKENQKEEILYSAGKPERGTTFELSLSGTIIIHRKLTLTSIHIPTRIYDWMDMEKSRVESKSSLKVTIIANLPDQNKELINNQQAELCKKKNGWFLELSTKSERIISHYKNQQITCFVSGLQPTELFYNAKKVFVQNPIEDYQIQELITRENQGSRFTIYQTNSKNLQIECVCSLDQKGRLELSDELARYIQDWWISYPKFVIVKIDNKKERIAYFTQRSNKDRLKKHIVIPYYGERKRVKVVFTHPNFKLSEQAQLDLALTNELQEEGYQIKQIVTHWFENAQHDDLEFEEKVWSLVQSAFIGQDAKLLPEAKLTCSSTPELTKCFDGLIHWQKKLGLLEIKSSIKIKNYPLDEVIGELLYLQERLQNNGTFILLFINTEVTTTEFARQITKLYGFVNNIILIGKEEMEILQAHPKLLLQIISNYLQIQKGLSFSEEMIHPITLTRTTKEELELEAGELLHQLVESPEKASKIVEDYCFLMNIPKADFLLLYKKKLEQLIDEELKIEQLSYQLTRSNSIYFQANILQEFHKELVLNGSLTIIEERRKENPEQQQDYSLLLDNWKLIETTLPKMCRLIQLRTPTLHQGLPFEIQTRRELEKKGYKVISNLIISQCGKHFEIDHLAIKDEQVELISCKDRSSFRYLPNLYFKITSAYYWLYLYHKILNNLNGQLFVRVKAEHLLPIRTRYLEYPPTTLSLTVTD